MAPPTPGILRGVLRCSCRHVLLYKNICSPHSCYCPYFKEQRLASVSTSVVTFVSHGNRENEVFLLGIVPDAAPPSLMAFGTLDGFSSS